jgi:hypothetical protein
LTLAAGPGQQDESAVADDECRDVAFEFAADGVADADPEDLAAFAMANFPAAELPLELVDVGFGPVLTGPAQGLVVGEAERPGGSLRRFVVGDPCAVGAGVGVQHDVAQPFDVFLLTS